MDHDALLEKLTTILVELQKHSSHLGRLAVVTPVLDSAGVAALDEEVRGILGEQTDALRFAKDEFDAAVSPAADALSEVMREQKNLLDERRRDAEAADGERRKAAFAEYKKAIAPAARERDVALARAQRRWDRKAAKIRNEFTRSVARASALAVLGAREERG